MEEKPYNLLISDLEKLSYLNFHYPNGLTIMRGVGYVAWEKIIGYETIALKKHGQNFARLQSRGGLSPMELRAILLDNDDVFNEGSEKAISWLRENGFLDA